MIYYGQELYHFGIPGQKWGQRRWQNEDGSLTEEGRIHYGYGAKKAAYKSDIKKLKRNYKNDIKRISKISDEDEYYNTVDKRIEKYVADKKTLKEEFKNSEEYKQHKEKVKKAMTIGAAAAATALAAYGVYKYVEATKDKAYVLSMKRGQEALSRVLHNADSKMFFSKDFDYSGGMIRKDNAIRNAADYLGFNIHNTAKQNSSSFKKAKDFLKGIGKYSIPELEERGFTTISGNEDINMVLDYYRRYLKDRSPFSN